MRKSKDAMPGSQQQVVLPHRQLRETIIQSCDCDGFRKGNGIWFDSQDLREFGSRSCPACKKPFKVEMR
jgi:hypothetical protein